METLLAPEAPRSSPVEIPAASFTVRQFGWLVVGATAAALVTAVVTSAISILVIRRAGGQPGTHDYVWAVGPLALFIIFVPVVSSRLRREKKIVWEARAVMGVVVRRDRARRSVTLTYRYRDAAGRLYSAKADDPTKKHNVGDHIEVLYTATCPEVSLPAFSFWFYTAPTVFPTEQFS